MEKTRKLRALYVTIGALSGGLAASLLTLIFAEGVAMAVGGLYVTFGTGCGAALGLFINGNVKVHQAGSEPK